MDDSQSCARVQGHKRWNLVRPMNPDLPCHHHPVSRPVPASAYGAIRAQLHYIALHCITLHYITLGAIRAQWLLSSAFLTAVKDHLIRLFEDINSFLNDSINPRSLWKQLLVINGTKWAKLSFKYLILDKITSLWQRLYFVTLHSGSYWKESLNCDVDQGLMLITSIFRVLMFSVWDGGRNWVSECRVCLRCARCDIQ